MKKIVCLIALLAMSCSNDIVSTKSNTQCQEKYGICRTVKMIAKTDNPNIFGVYQNVIDSLRYNGKTKADSTGKIYGLQDTTWILEFIDTIYPNICKEIYLYPVGILSRAVLNGQFEGNRATLSQFPENNDTLEVQ